jgi:Tfp pilus assembly protein PilE
MKDNNENRGWKMDDRVADDLCHVPPSILHPRIYRRRCSGLGVVELLVSLAIVASLLTAVAVAVDASFKSYAINQSESDLMQRARVTLHRMVATIRATALHAPADTTLASRFAAGEVVECPSIAMFDNDDVETEFTFDAAAKTLSVIRDGESHLLLDGVTVFKVKMEPMRSASSVKTGSGWDLLKRATIYLTIETTDRTGLAGESSSSSTISLADSVMPRRNAW